MDSVSHGGNIATRPEQVATTVFTNELGSRIFMRASRRTRFVTVQASSAKSTLNHVWTLAEAEKLRDLLTEVMVYDYRGWKISPPNFPEPWTATGPNYDASYEGPEDGWVDNGEQCSGRTREDLCDEIDAWIEANTQSGEQSK